MTESGSMFRVRQRDSRFGGAPGDSKDRFALPSVLYGVHASATGRLLRYKCQQTGETLVALYEDEPTAILALKTARDMERLANIAPPSKITTTSQYRESDQVLGWTHSKRITCGLMLVKPMTIQDVEREVLCNLHGVQISGCVVFKCPDDDKTVWSEIARVRFR